jgi:hypothetical protein
MSNIGLMTKLEPVGVCVERRGVHADALEGSGFMISSGSIIYPSSFP